MFKTLFLVQMRAILYSMFAKMNAKKKLTALGAGKKGLTVIFTVYVVGCLFFFFGMMFMQLCTQLVAAGQATVYFIFVGLTMFILMFIGSVFITQKQLYEATDNELLLSMPIPPLYIVLSRMAAVLAVNLIYGGFVAIPALVVYFTAAGFNLVTLLIGLFGSLLLSLLSLALSALCGWLLALLLSGTRFKNLFMSIFMMAYFFGFMGVYMNLQKFMSKLIENGATIADALRKAFPPLYHFGKAVAENDALSLLLLVVMTLVPAALVALLVARSFLKIASRGKGSSVSYKYTARRLRASSARAAMFKKELRRFLSSPNYFFNAGLGSVFLVLFAGWIAVKGAAFLPASITVNLQNIPLNLVDALQPLMIAAAMMFCVTTNASACSSLSLEGKAFASLKAMPLSYTDVIGPKIAVNFVWGAVPVLAVAAVCLFRLDFSPLTCFLLFALGIITQLFTACWGMFCNLLFPKLDWLNEVLVIKQSAASLFGILGSMGFMAAFVGVYIAFLYLVARDNPIPAAMNTAMPIGIVFFALMTAVTVVLLFTVMKNKYERLSA